MKNILLRQLNALRENIVPSFKEGGNCHWQTGVALNSIREEMLATAQGGNKDLMLRLCSPIEVEKPKRGGGEYTLNSQDALRLCDQLLSFLDQPHADISGDHATDAAMEHLDRLVPRCDSVFLVHGHDRENLLQLRNLLKERLGLETVILSEKPGRGRTILEKFEEEAGKCGFAFILLTPDDFVMSTSEKYAQARPNVLFEIGWFYGRLGRERVCILYRSGTTIPSDLEGISRIPFSRSISEKVTEIEKELMAAGVVTGRHSG